MSENKFIQHLKGKATSGSVVEIKNQATPASFANMPSGTSNANNVYADVRGNATVVAQGTTNWKLDGANLVLASNVSGDGNDYTGVYGASGAGLWVNATYTFPSTGDPNHPVAMIVNPNTKWVLKLCGDNLLANGANTIDFSLVITIGSSNIITKNFTIAEQANKFCKEFVIDFAESNQALIKAQGTTTMQVQLLCATASATARIYNGMTVFTALQRKVDASTVSADFANVEEVLRDGILPSDYFSNAEFIDEVEDGEQAYAVFERDGDNVNLAGWTPKDDIATTTQLNDEITARENADLGLQNQINTNKDTMDGHIANTSNPHQVTKAQVGLSNVDNTADLDKPISTATQTALDGKQNVSTANYQMGNASGGWTAMTNAQQDALNSGATTTNISQIATNTSTIAGHMADTNNPHSVTKTQVGLGNVDNTSDLNKPISTATQTALDGKQAKSASAYNMGNASGGWTAMTAAQQNALNSGATTTNIGQIATNTTNIANEIIDRQNADNGLQTQIDAIVSKSDVVDIVGTYAELQAYDTSSLGNNDVVKVISDSTHNNAPSYYRWVITGGVGAWVYIGSESETYTKAETDALLNGKQNVISDLATIRAGAALGATAVQPSDLATVATSGSYNDLSNKPTIPAAQVNSDWNANSGVAQILNKPTLGTAAAADTTDFATAAQGALADTAVQPADLATVATSGSYTDLSDTPTIPTVNNPTITITQGGVTKGSFSLNQSSGDTIALDAGGGSNVDIDNSTITKNASDKIQAVATVNANTAAGATNPVYDWVGTLAEYTAQNIATTHPDWLCYITDDNTAQAFDAYSKTESDARYVQQGHQVIDFQEPTSANNYTWYRKYDDGWVEQGGYSAGSGTWGVKTITLPVAMRTAYYSLDVCGTTPATDFTSTNTATIRGGSRNSATNITATSFVCQSNNDVRWQVKGMAA
jgi:hypothetical protein